MKILKKKIEVCGRINQNIKNNNFYFNKDYQTKKISKKRKNKKMFSFYIAFQWMKKLHLSDAHYGFLKVNGKIEL